MCSSFIVTKRRGFGFSGASGVVVNAGACPTRDMSSNKKRLKLLKSHHRQKRQLMPQTDRRCNSPGKKFTALKTRFPREMRILSRTSLCRIQRSFELTNKLIWREKRPKFKLTKRHRYPIRTPVHQHLFLWNTSPEGGFLNIPLDTGIAILKTHVFPLVLRKIAVHPLLRLRERQALSIQVFSCLQTPRLLLHRPNAVHLCARLWNLSMCHAILTRHVQPQRCPFQ